MRTAICSLLFIAVALIWSCPAGAADSLASVVDTRSFFESRDDTPHPPDSRSTTIYVDDDNTTGPWDGTLEHPYQYIQDGINTASPGENVYVFEGTYYEHISIDKSIHLFGEGKTTTIIDGGNTDNVVTISANCVYMTGFTVQRSGIGDPYKGINVRSSQNTIINNIIQNNYYGICVYAWNIRDNNIIYNKITGNVRGLYLRRSQINIIYSNNFEYNEYGIILSNDTYNNRIYHNNFIENAQNAWELYDNDNSWDDGYPSGGNYWSDFDEPGEGAYDNNGDGIVDSSYQIPDGFNLDMYPLINMYDYPLYANANGPYEAAVNDPVEFFGDAYGGTKPYSWHWEFGYGDSSEQQNPIHSYASVGEYIAILTVTDSIGSIASDSTTVYIRFPFIWVDDDYDTSTAGWGYDHFDTITDGVDAAASAGTVYVFNGIYDEQVVVDKYVHLIGENKDSTIVSGIGTGHVVKVSADDVSITGFTTKDGWWGIELNTVDSVKVNSCICTDNSAGIMLKTATNATIVSCMLQNNTDGILFYPESFNNDNRIIDNDIQYNSETGILFEHCCHQSNLIQGNRIAHNGNIGINMLTCWYNEISYNLFLYNVSYAIGILQCMCGGEDNVIHHNDFILNNNVSVQAYDATYEGRNYWYSQSDSQGNFWSDYDGQDLNGDGIGDTPYLIKWSYYHDVYPLMEPVGDCPFFTIAEGPSAPEAVYIPIQFTGKAFGGIQPYIWNWEFGDGHDSGEQNPIHSYCDPDTYSVVLTVTDSINQSVSDTISVSIENIRAIAQGPSDPVAVYVPIQFTGDVYGGAMPYTWYWDFGDGDFSFEQNPIHSFEQHGVHTVVLTVTDSVSHTDEDTILVTIVKVHNVDKDLYYTRIQEAIDDADSSNTICVYNGVFYEGLITIDKPLKLLGEDRNTTIIDGEGISGNVIQTEVDSVIINGFTIKNCDNWEGKAGIKIHANHISITDNILISNHRNGIAFRDGSCYNTISGNEIISNSYCGIKLYNDCRHNTIFDNNIYGNGQYGLYFYNSSDSNEVYHNNFTNSSSNNARDECVNVWDDGYPSGGNRWGDYTGSDEFSGPDQNLPGADGIGDTPYSIPGGSNLDRYPIVDDQPPEAIDDLIILLESGTKSTAGDMRLIWTEPEDDVGVTRYVIYRSTVAGSTGDSLAETTDTTYLDIGTAGDELTNFFYTVRAVDAVGNKSGESNKVGEFDRGPINGE